jgi:hypothetical protein
MSYFCVIYTNIANKNTKKAHLVCSNALFRTKMANKSYVSNAIFLATPLINTAHLPVGVPPTAVTAPTGLETEPKRHWLFPVAVSLIPNITTGANPPSLFKAPRMVLLFPVTEIP